MGYTYLNLLDSPDRLQISMTLTTVIVPLLPNFLGLDDLLNIDNIYFERMVDRIYSTELQLNRANSSDTEAPFLDLNLCISNGIVSTKIYDKRDDFDFDIVNFLFSGWRCPPAYLILSQTQYLVR